VPAGDLASALGSGPDGLTRADAALRLAQCGPNLARPRSGHQLPHLLARQILSPLVLILLVGAAISMMLKDWSDAAIIAIIVLGSAALGVVQEYRAARAVALLQSKLALASTVLRDGAPVSVPASQIVPGDRVRLSAGNLVPADGILLEARDLMVNEAALTGESFPVEKRPGVSPASAALAARRNALFAGSSVRSGTATMLIVRTGAASEYGALAKRLAKREPETDFQRGVKRFGELLLRTMFIIVVFVLGANQLLGRPFGESLLFAVALSVGLSPELLPAIVTVTLSAGARRMAQRGVIVRKLEAIEMLGSLDVVCTDKTGTITTGEVALARAVGPGGTDDREALQAAFVNAVLETGIANPLDQALVKAGRDCGMDERALQKIDEIPYDFGRRRLTIVVAEADGSHRLIAKGAVDEMLSICTSVREPTGAVPLTQPGKQDLVRFVHEQGMEGLRVLAVGHRLFTAKASYDVEDEQGLTLDGFLLFSDPAKPDAEEAIAALSRMGVGIKIVTGDNRHVAAHVAGQVGLNAAEILTGTQIANMRDEALWHAAERITLFAEIDPQQKERIVRALQHRGHAVGFLGDGINDAPALHTADVGISVEGAVDVARESADLVLLTPDLGVLRGGIEDGRRTFANTMKYIAITTSANFGNMVSMALAVPLLPFLPLLPKQILLNNFLSDLPSMAISTDQVDPELAAVPQRWDIRRIGWFMIVFGAISSLFDLATFGLLLRVFEAGEVEFHTIWFLVSLLTELAVVLVLRTWRPAWRSKPGRLLLWSSVATSGVAIVLPFIPQAQELFGFAALTGGAVATVFAILAGYIAATEGAKLLFARKIGFAAGPVHPPRRRSAR
jgi:Mg2+-importing ATPase